MNNKNKKIIICCDGTWNSPNQEKDNRPVPTNVVKLVRAIKPISADGINQIVFYDQGVGTSGGPVARMIGGATGLGISQNILECYRFLANNYRQGDEIYCFGFSRGAFTARSFAGLVASFGLLSKNDIDQLPIVYKLSRMHPDNRPEHKLFQEVEQLTTHSGKPRFKFIGVWDTVGALGAPTPMLGWISRKLWVGFHNTRLSNTDYAYHALAIDERRKPFKPSVWSAAEDCKEMKQVWFSGAHSNIGGGYPEAGLCDLAFNWMVKMSTQKGLELDFDQDYLKDKQKVDANYQGSLVDSYSLMYKIMGPYRRPIGQLYDDPDDKKAGVNEMMHQSVAERHAENLLTYNPENNQQGLKNLPIEPY